MIIRLANVRENFTFLRSEWNKCPFKSHFFRRVYEKHEFAYKYPLVTLESTVYIPQSSSREFKSTSTSRFAQLLLKGNMYFYDSRIAPSYTVGYELSFHFYVWRILHIFITLVLLYVSRRVQRVCMIYISTATTTFAWYCRRPPTINRQLNAVARQNSRYALTWKW